MFAKVAKRRSKSNNKETIRDVIGLTIVIVVMASLMYSAFIFCQLSRLSELEDRTLSSETGAEKYLSHYKFEYRSALSRCNSDVIISSYASEFTRSSMINDNFCDCKKGADEFSTAACSYILVGHRAFQCKSARGQNGKVSLRGEDKSQTETIFPSRVNDSVCDCEDCSDEDKFGDGLHSSRA